MSKRSRSFYRNLDVRRALLVSLPFGLAGICAQNLHAVDHNANDLASLRAALTAVNAVTSDDRIIIASGTITLDAGRLNAGTGDLEITKTGGSLEIIGAGQGSTIIDANSEDRAFLISPSSGVPR